MDNKEKEYLKNVSNNQRIIRAEILFTPLLIILPLVVGFFLIYDWYYGGFPNNIYEFNGELILGIIILVSNIIFDIPFLKSLVSYKKK